MPIHACMQHVPMALPHIILGPLSMLPRPKPLAMDRTSVNRGRLLDARSGTRRGAAPSAGPNGPTRCAMAVPAQILKVRRVAYMICARMDRSSHLWPILPIQLLFPTRKLTNRGDLLCLSFIQSVRIYHNFSAYAFLHRCPSAAFRLSAATSTRKRFSSVICCIFSCSFS